MLKNNPEMVKPIAEMERRLSGNTYMYIPKGDIKNTKLLRSAIHDGDIIAIITKKNGLDTSHIGIAVWHKDGLHMLNASQIHKKVVEEPMTRLYAEASVASGHQNRKNQLILTTTLRGCACLKCTNQEI